MDLISIIGEYSILENSSAKTYRTMVIQTDNEDERLVLPVTPFKYSVTTEQNNKVVDILDFGENLIFGNTKLKKLKVNCFFPQMSHNYTFVVGDNKNPDECIELITKWKENKKPVRVIITESPVNLMMGIIEFSYKERDGSRDIYYELEFTESKEFNIPAANYKKTVDETSGLKDRVTTGLSDWARQSLIQYGTDLLEKSKAALGNFSSLGSFKKSNNISRLTQNFKSSWKF